MSERVQMIQSFYSAINEDARLDRSRQGQLEYFTTMEYIHRYTQTGSKILEIGAGTGRYSIALAKHHLATCEKRELLGCSSHLLYICQKDLT